MFEAPRADHLGETGERIRGQDGVMPTFASLPALAKCSSRKLESVPPIRTHGSPEVLLDSGPVIGDDRGVNIAVKVSKAPARHAGWSFSPAQAARRQAIDQECVPVPSTLGAGCDGGQRVGSSMVPVTK
jgi:hypothetical protein